MSHLKKIGEQVVGMAKANGVGRGSIYYFYWRGGLEFKVHVTTTRDARRKPKANAALEGKK